MKYFIKTSVFIFILFFGICSGYAANAENKMPENLKVLTSEQVQKISDNEYSIVYYSNVNSIDISFDFGNEDEYTEEEINDKISKISVIGDDNSICGSIKNEEEPVIEINLHEGENKILLKNNEDNTIIIKLNIIHKKVNIEGIPQNIKEGDNFSLKWNIKDVDNNTIHAQWYTYGIGTMLLSKNGNATIVNGGIGKAAAILYDVNSKPIGHIDVSINAVGTGKYGWIKNDGKWYYIDPETKCFKLGFITSNDNIYYINSTGEMAAGWVKDNGIWYHMGEDGTMNKGWMKIDHKWYYFNDDGSMLKGWLEYAGKKYYFGEDGAMASGSIYIDGNVYTFAENGALVI